MHSDNEIMEVAKALAKKVIDLDKTCDRSKLHAIELEHLKDIAALARMITPDLSDYNPGDDQGAIS